MPRTLLAAIAAILVNVLVSQQATAFEFAPIVQEFSPKGGGAVRSFVIRNTQAETVAIQIESFQRTTDEFGEEQRKPEYDDFVISPPQLVLQPGMSQAVRIQWIGDPEPQQELSYRLIVSQVPIKYAAETTEEVSATLHMGYRYEAAIYVTPPRAKPKAELVSAQPAEDETGNQVLRLSLKSVGETRAILEDPTLLVTSASSEETARLSGDLVSALHMRNLISGSSAVIDLPWPSSIPYGPVTATFDTNYYAN